MNTAKLASGITLLVIGIAVLVEGILARVADTEIWLTNTDQANLAITVAVITLIVSVSLLWDSRG